MDTRAPPPQGAPPSYAFVTRVYRKSLQPIVVCLAVIGMVWCIFAAIGFFRNAPIYNSNGASKLGVFAIVVGILYSSIVVIELFGIFAARSQKVPLVRTFAYLSILVTAIVAAAGLIQIILHFTEKSLIINTCSTLATGATVYRYTGLFGPVSTDSLSAAGAESWCTRYYNRDSWTSILSFLITTGLAAFYTTVAWAYLRQVLDPTSPVNVAREPGRFTGAPAGYPSHYNPPYNGAPGYGFSGYGPGQQQPGGGYWGYPAHGQDYVPPYPGKPPGFVEEDAKAGNDTRVEIGR